MCRNSNPGNEWFERLDGICEIKKSTCGGTSRPTIGTWRARRIIGGVLQERLLGRIIQQQDSFFVTKPMAKSSHSVIGGYTGMQPLKSGHLTKNESCS
jgi:hypothetical protein